MGARVGVDVGGTNTDLVLESDRGVFVHKVQSTPHDQSVWVLKGLLELCEMAGVTRNDIDIVVHGTTGECQEFRVWAAVAGSSGPGGTLPL